MNYFIVAGEASGDLHSANLAKELFKEDKSASIVGWGGSKMKQAGVTITKDYKELAIMGFIEIVTRIPEIYRNLKQATKEIIDQNTDVVLLVDFSGFNLRLAKALKKNNYTGKIFYYISPKLWVWNSKRVNKIRKYIDAVFCILPFEVDFYEEHGYHNSFYIGNPLMDEIESFEPDPNFLEQHQHIKKPIIALLPGSRTNEIQHILPTMLKIIPHYPHYNFVIAGVPSVKSIIEDTFTQTGIRTEIIYDDTYNLLVQSDLALVTSGTATLETALLGTPLVLCYKGSFVSYNIAKLVVQLKYIGLPNLILDKEMVPELIQENLTVPNLRTQIDSLLTNEQTIKDFKNNVYLLREKVGDAGASSTAAKKIYQLASQMN